MKQNKGIALLLALLLALSLAACGGGTAQPEKTPEEPAQEAAQTPEEEPAVPAEEPQTPEEKPAAPAEESNLPVEEEPQLGAIQTADFTQEQQGMLPVLDSILLCNHENDIAYDPADPAYVWNVVYYLLSNWELNLQTTGDGEQADGSRLFVRMSVEECAFAAFADLGDLPLDDPETMGWGLSYDEAWDAIRWQPSDRGDTDSQLLSWQDHGDGTYTAVARLYIVSEDVTLAEGTFQLRDNQNLSATIDPIFFYEVTGAETVTYPYS